MLFGRGLGKTQHMTSAQGSRRELKMPVSASYGYSPGLREHGRRGFAHGESALAVQPFSQESSKKLRHVLDDDDRNWKVRRQHWQKSLKSGRTSC